jgi:carboxyl-terminal processing protease
VFVVKCAQGYTVQKEQLPMPRRPRTAISFALTVFSVFPLAHAAEPVLSAPAQAYLDEAIGAIRADALYADRVDWKALKPKLEALADGAVTPADTYPAIRTALAALDDHHSHLALPEFIRHVLTTNDTTDFGQASRLLSPVGYIAMPAYTGLQASRRSAFADEMQQRLVDLRVAGACGFIIDLRRDHGGDMFPMIAGLAPLFADGPIGSFVESHGQTIWRVENGGVRNAWNDVKPANVHPLKRGVSLPVAVLTGPGTASSGESVLVSFIGRPATRSFGQPSAGLSTSTGFHPLSDGAALAVVNAVLADRTGRRYGGPIAPDEAVKAGPPDTSIEADPVVDAARRWLVAQPGCGSN